MQVIYTYVSINKVMLLTFNMSNSASRQVDRFIERFEGKNKLYREYQRIEMQGDFKEYYGFELEEVRAYGSFQAFRFLRKALDEIKFYQRERKQKYIKDNLFNSNGTRNEIAIAKEIEMTKKDYEKYTSDTYEDKINWAYKTYGNYEKNSELTELFDYLKSDQFWIEVASEGKKHKLILRKWSAEAFDKFEFMHNGMECLIFDERLWPDCPQIIEENKRIKEKLEKKWEKEKKDYIKKGYERRFAKMAEINPYSYRGHFRYMYGSPNYINYYLNKLPQSVQNKYDGHTWTASVEMFYITGIGVHTFLIPEFQNIKVDIFTDKPNT